MIRLQIKQLLRLQIVIHRSNLDPLIRRRIKVGSILIRKSADRILIRRSKQLIRLRIS